MESDFESTNTSHYTTEDELFIETETFNLTTQRENRITSEYMTKYEKAYILGVRATQLSMNAPPMVEIGNLTDAFSIAEKELREKKVPFVLRRRLPDGTFEYWNIKEMIVPE